MTLVEILVALVVFSAVMAGAMRSLRSENRAFAVGADRMDMLQNLRYAGRTLSRDLRVVGSNVPPDQPFLVYGGPEVIAFNGDYATNVANDVFAVYHDPDAPTGAVTAMTVAQSISIPNSSFQYPTTDYRVGTQNSPAETLIFFFTPDSTTTRTDDYALFRQVNNQHPELVSRNLLQTPGRDFFEYYRLVSDEVTQIPPAGLPVQHTVAFHQSVADTGAVAAIDSVRGVRVNFTATNGATGAGERTRALSRLVDLPNAGLAHRKTCGDEPLLGTSLAAVAMLDVNGDPLVRLSWAPAIDESGGEKDVVRYVIWRRLDANPDWGDPRLSVPAGQPSYLYDDTDVDGGVTYRFAMAAQDCTPSLSNTSSTGPVTVP